MCTDWDYVQVRDFKYLNSLWDEVEPKVSMIGLQDSIEDLGDKILSELDIPISPKPLDAQQSKFFKAVYQHPSRTDNQRFMEKL